MRTKEEYVSLLQETINYYSEDISRRGIDYTFNDSTGVSSKRCAYITPTGDMCAVGRCMIDPEEFKDVDMGIDGLLEDEGHIILKEEYRGFDDWFWKELQILHDASNNWCIGGLTNEGKTKRRRILDRLEKIFNSQNTLV